MGKIKFETIQGWAYFLESYKYSNFYEKKEDAEIWFKKYDKKVGKILERDLILKRTELKRKI
tara:strand:+ start:57 stop:242 length:186 start_codon:yes stop_codon:yes gene_type:complete